ncbi:MAG: lipopolysaccharide biosynthesis protein [Pseudomonadota bacterium]
MGRHLLVYLPVYLAQALVGFGGVILFTRLMEPGQYGRFTLLLAAIGLAQAILFTWLNAAIARHHARAERKQALGRHLQTSLVTASSVGIACMAIAIAIAWFAPVSPALSIAVLAAAALLALRGVFDAVLETRRAAGEAVWYASLETFALGVGFVLAAVLVMTTGQGASAAIAGMAIAVLLALIVGLPPLAILARKDRARRVRLAAFFAYGAPITASLVFEHLLSVGDRFIIVAFLGEAPTGAYAAGYGIADRSVDIVFIWLGMTAAPLTVMALERHGADAARSVAEDAARLMGLIGIPAAVGLAMVADPLAHVLIDEALAPQSAAVMPLVAIAALLNGIMVYFFHKAFVLSRRTTDMAILMAIGAALNVALNFILIPIMGLTGAALATVIAYAFALAASAWRAEIVFPLDIPWKDWGKCGFAAGVMALALFATPKPDGALANLLIQLLVGVVAYAVTAWTSDAAGCRTMALGWLAGRREKPMEIKAP